MFISGLFILIVLAATVAVIVAVVALLVSTLRGSGGEERYCGKCGYSVRGLMANRCPECGSDFNTVGLLDRPPGRRWQPIVLALVWAVVSPVIFFYLAVAILSNAPQHQITNAFELWHRPQSEAYTRAHIVYNASELTGWRSGQSRPQKSHWQVMFEHEGFTLDVQGDMLTETVTIADGVVTRVQKGEVSDRLLTEALVEAFPEADAESLAEEAGDIARRLAFRIDPSLAEPIPASFEYMGNAGSSTWKTPRPMNLIVVFAFFSLLWVAGLLGIMFWSRRAAASQA